MARLKVKDIMRPSAVHVPICDENASIEDAARTMREYDVCRLIAIKNNQAIGLVTLKSLLQSSADRATRNRVLRALAWPK